MKVVLPSYGKDLDKSFDPHTSIGKAWSRLSEHRFRFTDRGYEDCRTTVCQCAFLCEAAKQSRQVTAFELGRG